MAAFLKWPSKIYKGCPKDSWLAKTMLAQELVDLVTGGYLL